MKANINTIIISLCILMAGCNEPVQENPAEPVVNAKIINTYNDIALENAIISQHTLYPYHFVDNGAELNELGKHDLAVLTRHFVKEAGHLNIRKHDTSAELYEARVESVQRRLKEAGINMDRISISDYMPGGSGIPSENILVILAEKDEPAPAKEQTLF